MAMITCPNCGEQISDKAKKCVHCGEVLIPEEKKCCPDCGAELEEEVDSCPKCGCPIENNSESRIPQQVEVTGVKVSTRSKKLIVTGIIVAMAIVMAIIAGGNAYKKKQSEKYGKNLNVAAYTIMISASTVENSGNLIKQVWYNAIYKNSDSKTDKYTRPNGYYVSDFNDALQNLLSDSSFKEQIEKINDNKESINTLMKKLKNPPKEYKEAYESLSKLYDAYISLTSLVTSPSGSLQTYSQSFNNADNETVKCYNALKMYLEK